MFMWHILGRVKIIESEVITVSLEPLVEFQKLSFTIGKAFLKLHIQGGAGDASNGGLEPHTKEVELLGQGEGGVMIIPELAEAPIFREEADIVGMVVVLRMRIREDGGRRRVKEFVKGSKSGGTETRQVVILVLHHARHSQSSSSLSLVLSTSLYKHGCSVRAYKRLP